MNWVDRVNTERDIASFIDEEFLTKHLQTDDISDLNWMKIFNSNICLDKCFIVAYIDHINWKWLIRPLPEPIVHRFHRFIIQWDAQLYGPPRTIEFMIQYRNLFNWNYLSANPPKWFNEYHAEIFENSLNWKSLTSRAISYSMNTISRHCNELDWNWISANYAMDETFAFRFMNHINWDIDDLDVSNLSTEFLYDVHNARQTAYDIYIRHKKPEIKTRFDIMVGSMMACGFDPRAPLRIGATISFRFFYTHWKELDISELQGRKMLTDNMINLLSDYSDTNSTYDSNDDLLMENEVLQ